MIICNEIENVITYMREVTGDESLVLEYQPDNGEYGSFWLVRENCSICLYSDGRTPVDDVIKEVYSIKNGMQLAMQK